MDWREFWIEHNGERRDALTFGAGFLPELSRIANSYAMHATWFLEWGSGVSTLLLARLAAARGGRLITIDHSIAQPMPNPS